jgi:CHAT domain-containing protein
MSPLNYFKVIIFLFLLLHSGAAFGSPEKIKNYLNKGQYNALYSLYQSQSEAAEKSFNFDLFIEANLRQIQILQWFGANYLALEKLLQLEDYLEKRQMISEQYLVELSRVREAIFFNLNLYQNALLEGENTLNLRLQNRLSPETAQLDFFLLKANVFINYSATDSAAFYLNLIESSPTFKNVSNGFFSKFYMLKAQYYSLENPSKFLIIDSLLLRSQAYFEPISPLHKASFISDEVGVFSELILGSPENQILYKRFEKSATLANDIFDEFLGFYNKFSAENFVRLAIVNQNLGHFSLAENNFKEALNRIQFTPSSVSSIDAHLAALIQKYYIFSGKEQSLNRQIENLDNSVLLWQDFLSQLSINNYDGVKDKFGVTPYGSASVAYLKRYKNKGNESDFIKAFDYYQQQAYRFLFEEKFGEKNDNTRDFKLKHYLNSNAEKVNFDYYLLGLNQKLHLKNFNAEEVRLSSLNKSLHDDFDETKNLIKLLGKKAQGDAASLVFIADAYFPNQLGAILFYRGNYFVEVINLPENFIENSFLSSIYNVGFDDFKSSSFLIYQYLLAWVEPILDEKISRLTIYPSGKLVHFPFELLIADTTGDSFSELNYLLKKYQINYKLSPKLGLANENSVSVDVTGNKLLALYPNDYDYFSLSNLPFSESLFDNLARSIEGEFLADSMATKENLNTKFQDFNVIQFITHGSGNLINPEKNKIYLYNEVLRLSDVYRLKTEKNPLVILAGCETGLGGYDFSEGGINFTRAFFYAGAESVLTSFWKLDDKATSEILSRYYQNLSQGESSADALHKAKVTYLEEARGRTAHPVYWAGLYHTGSNQKINLNSNRFNFNYMWFGLGVIILVITGKLLRRLN